MSIPFVRQLPNNRRVLQEIKCSERIEEIAGEFIAKGGRYLVEILPKVGSPNIRLVACVLSEDGEQVDIVEETVENGPELANAVNRVVEASINHFRDTTAETRH